MDHCTNGLANIASARTAPPIAPAVCAGMYAAMSRTAGPSWVRRPVSQAGRKRDDRIEVRAGDGPEQRDEHVQAERR